MTTRTLLLALFACTHPQQYEFAMPNSIEDVRGRLLPLVEGHPTAEAREFMGSHGFSCEEPLPSAADAHAHVCHVAQRPKWRVTLLDRNGRIADVQAYSERK